jgi:hypothetical protein
MTYPLLVFTLAAFGALVGLFQGCTRPIPGPTPVPTVDAGPRDIFTGRTFDCSDVDTSAAAPKASACGDSEDVSGCMVIYADGGAPLAALVCAARDVQVAAFIEIAKGTAGPETRARAAALRAWMLAEKIQLRN